MCLDLMSQSSPRISEDCLFCVSTGALTLDPVALYCAEAWLTPHRPALTMSPSMLSTVMSSGHVPSQKVHRELHSSTMENNTENTTTWGLWGRDHAEMICHIYVPFPCLCLYLSVRTVPRYIFSECARAKDGGCASAQYGALTLVKQTKLSD